MTKKAEQRTEIRDPEWLVFFLTRAMDRDLCVRINCTTCGSHAFEQELSAETHRCYQPTDGFLDPGQPALFLAEMLAKLDVHRKGSDYLRGSVMKIIYDLEKVFVRREDGVTLDDVLGNSWAGGILADMRAHHERVQQARRDFKRSQNPKFVEAERARKRARKAWRHAERLERKKQRDRIWRELHG